MKAAVERIDGDSVVTDSVELPVTQAVYSDSLYTAYVSGYMPRLDSISFVERRVTESIVIDRTGRWSVGVTAGIGCGASGRVDPFIGIGVTYSLFKW